ncbi:MAG: phage major capsid protein [Leptolyngbyaceae cyanobacterium RM2_2_4]|nr:phage major capsid protein [Leptolyngbyaceae cyanobacterium RM2_2_4]
MVLGVIERGWIENRKLYTEVRFSNRSEAQEYRKDVDDGIITNTSIRARINPDMVEESDGIWYLRGWEAMELSLVSIPADPSVGYKRQISMRKDTMTEATINKPTDRDAILGLGQRMNLDHLALQCLQRGLTFEQTVDEFLKAQNVQRSQEIVPKLGLEPKDQKRYNIVEAIRCTLPEFANSPEIGFYQEVTRSLVSKHGYPVSQGGFLLPLADLPVAKYARQAEIQRAQSAGSFALGGALIDEELLIGSLIDFLRNQTVLLTLGITTIPNCVGPLAIPREVSTYQTEFIPEGSAGPISDITFDQVTFTPRQISGRAAVSRLMLQQTTLAMEAFIINRLSQDLSINLDRRGLVGLGTAGEPIGVLNEIGIPEFQANPTNPNAGAQIDFDRLYDAELELKERNSFQGRLGYLTTHRIVNSLLKRKDSTGAYIWRGRDEPLYDMAPPRFNGIPFVGSNQMPNNLVKGTSAANLNALILGNWADHVLALWGGLEVLANPYGAGFDSGAIVVRAFQTMDCRVIRPVSFVRYKDLTP